MTEGRPLQTRSMVDAVEAALRELLLTGTVDAGKMITEVGVASQYNVGRPTAKAALDRLTSDGILIREGRRGLRVRELSRSDIQDLYEARILIESHVHSRLAAEGGAPKEALQHNEMLRIGAAHSDAGVVVSSDISMHRALVTAYGNERISKMHASLMAEAHVCMARVQANQLLRADHIADEHREILNAIMNGDSSTAAQCTRTHLENARDKLLNSLFAA